MQKIKIMDNKSWQVVKHTNRYKVDIMVLEPGERVDVAENKYAHSEQWMYIVAGNGEMVIGNEAARIEPWDLFLIEGRETSVIQNTGNKPLGVFNIYTPRVN